MLTAEGADVEGEEALGAAFLHDGLEADGLAIAWWAVHDDAALKSSYISARTAVARDMPHTFQGIASSL